MARVMELPADPLVATVRHEVAVQTGQVQDLARLGRRLQALDGFVVVIAHQHGAGIVDMSALLTTTMPYMKVVIDRFTEENLDHIQLCVGGAPVSEMFAEEIGADGYAADAASAIDLFRSLDAARAKR